MLRDSTDSDLELDVVRTFEQIKHSMPPVSETKHNIQT